MTEGGFPLDEAVTFLGDRLPKSPEVMVVLGSGLSDLSAVVSDGVSIPFQEIPGFPAAGVLGHAGRMVSGRLEGNAVLMQAGRFHFYEGHDPSVVVAPIRIAAALGATTVILTNAAGGIAPDLDPGDILLLDDHVNLMARNPLVGPVVGDEDRFPDMSAPYDRELQALAQGAADAMGFHLRTGVYAAVLGPSYETPAEIRFLSEIGADAVGMSTVPETVAARALGLRVLAFSLITNKAAGLGEGGLHHDEVLEAGRVAGGRLGELVRAVLKRIGGVPFFPG
jgi:purine-nucleoside phosphorylase